MMRGHVSSIMLRRGPRHRRASIEYAREHQLDARWLSLVLGTSVNHAANLLGFKLDGTPLRKRAS